MNRILACLAFLLASVPAIAAAADPITVKSGATVSIHSSQVDFDITDRPAHGTATKVTIAPPGSGFRLDYTADSAGTSSTDKVGYTPKTGGTGEMVIPIKIELAAPEFSTKVYEQAGRAILLLFALAVLLESALALLFNWKPFVERLVPRAVRPVIAFLAAYLVVSLLNIDVMAALANSLNGAPAQPSTTGQLLTAMVLAGGSAGVNNMLIALGFRYVRTPETTAPKAPPDKAWLAVRAVEGKSRGDLLVYLNSPGADHALLGVIKGRSKPNSPLSWFITDRGRVPGYGGHTVDPDKDYTIDVHGRDENGLPLKLEPPIGPLKFAKGAVVDIDVKL
jgi:hypothetical protein